MNENVNVCITPKGDKPVLHFSQFDNERVFTVTVLADDGESAAVLTGLDIEFRLRKTDSHVVTIAPESVADNVITFKTTKQLCACCGQNIASVVLMDNELIVSTLDILVDIQRDILSGGLTSESDIRNLTTQVEQIVPEVIGDDYYNKQEVDDLLAEHTFDPTNYYDKTDVDELIVEHTFDPSNYYDKTDVDGFLSDKADADDVYTKTEIDNLLAGLITDYGYLDATLQSPISTNGDTNTHTIIENNVTLNKGRYLIIMSSITIDNVSTPSYNWYLELLIAGKAPRLATYSKEGFFSGMGIVNIDSNIVNSPAQLVIRSANANKTVNVAAFQSVSVAIIKLTN